MDLFTIVDRDEFRYGSRIWRQFLPRPIVSSSRTKQGPVSVRFKRRTLTASNVSTDSTSEPIPHKPTILIDRLNAILFGVVVSVLVTTPLAINTAVYHITVLPKYLILIIGSSLSLLLMAFIASLAVRCNRRLPGLKSKQMVLSLLYVVSVGLSTWFGVAPLASVFGSLQSLMGLLSHICFFICFLGLIIAIGESEDRLVGVLWAMAVTGLLTAAYATMQFVGRDPFLSAVSYSFGSQVGRVLRVPGTLGHSNYLGNFLLFTTPMSAALTLLSRGRARRITFAGVMLSLAALVFSGARGAWLGAVVAAVVFAWLCLQQRPVTALLRSGRKSVAAIITAVIVLICIGLIMASPRQSNLTRRVRSSAFDLTGSGRTLLWRDAVKMIPAYSLTGCGPESFSKAFLAYKSPQLAYNAPQLNNESSHNAYLDAFICYGLVGGFLYLAIIISMFISLVYSRRQTSSWRIRIVIDGLLAALIGVCVHSFFIYNQIPTGLYFFALLALTMAVRNIVISQQARIVNCPGEAQSDHIAAWTIRIGWKRLLMRWFVPAVSIAVLICAVWHALEIWRADAAIKRAFDAAAARDYDKLVSNGEVAVGHGNVTGAFDYLFARALSNYADLATASDRGNIDKALERQRNQAVELALKHAELGLTHSLTPEANYVLLAYLALAANNQEKLFAYATQAVVWDKNLFSAHWLMAEALLGKGDRDAAATEAQEAIALRPSSIEARSVMARARGEVQVADRRTQGLLELAQVAEGKSKLTKASRLLKRAIREAQAPCAPCHRALALVYEKLAFYDAAMDEWGTMISESPELAAREDISLRMKSLKDKAAAQHGNRP